jgi:methanogenic corrinoid protein MtbC1
MPSTRTTSSRDEPLQSIGSAVATLRRTFPEVSPSMLRFLESEGLVVPQRTQGGHRLYSADDLARVIQIRQWQAQGASIRQVRTRLESQGALPAVEDLRATLLARLMAGDVAGSRQVVLGADDHGMPIARVLGAVIQPVMVEVGTRWHAGTLLVSQEKECSEVMRDLIAELTLRHLPNQPSGPTVVAACVEGELHELGLRMVCSLLRTYGYEVHYLGASVAARFLVEQVRQHGPDAVLLSAKLSINLSAVQEAVQAVLAEVHGDARPVIMVGGDGVEAGAEAVRAAGAIPVSEVGLDDIAGALGAALAPKLGGARRNRSTT